MVIRGLCLCLTGLHGLDLSPGRALGTSELVGTDVVGISVEAGIAVEAVRISLGQPVEAAILRVRHLRLVY